MVRRCGPTASGTLEPSYLPARSGQLAIEVAPEQENLLLHVAGPLHRLGPAAPIRQGGCWRSGSLVRFTRRSTVSAGCHGVRAAEYCGQGLQANPEPGVAPVDRAGQGEETCSCRRARRRSSFGRGANDESKGYRRRGHGHRHAVEPFLARAELADRAPQPVANPLSSSRIEDARSGSGTRNTRSFRPGNHGSGTLFGSPLPPCWRLAR
jgi:hypothetical protein